MIWHVKDLPQIFPAISKDISVWEYVFLLFPYSAFGVSFVSAFVGFASVFAVTAFVTFARTANA